MKTFFKIIFLILGIFTFILPNNVFSENEQEQLELIESYIKNYKKNLNFAIKKYNIIDKKIEQKTKVLNELLEISKKAKQIEDAEKMEQIIKYLNKNLKELNNEVKEILKIWKEDFDKKLENHKQSYVNLGRKISEKLDIIVFEINRKKLNKKILNLKEYILKTNTEKLASNSNSFKYFGNLKFNSEEEIKNRFKEIIKNTRTNILKIKEILKEDY